MHHVVVFRIDSCVPGTIDNVLFNFMSEKVSINCIWCNIIFRTKVNSVCENESCGLFFGPTAIHQYLLGN